MKGERNTRLPSKTAASMFAESQETDRPLPCPYAGPLNLLY